MNPRIAKLAAKYERNAAKITALEEEQKELEKRLRELRNNDILEVAHAFSMDAEQLASLLNGLKTRLPRRCDMTPQRRYIMRNEWRLGILVLTVLMACSLLAAPAFAASAETELSVTGESGTPARQETPKAAPDKKQETKQEQIKDDSWTPEPVQEQSAETVSAPIEITPGEPFSEGSDITTRDLLYDKATNKQFVVVEDRQGNTFYMVIDYDSPTDEDGEHYTTYFLNPVDLSDLTALAGEQKEEEPEEPLVCTCKDKCHLGSIDPACEVCRSDMGACLGVEQVKEEPAELPPQPQSGINPVAVLILLAMLGGGGAYAYFKLVKNKPQTKGNVDLDDYNFGDEEDDEVWETEEGEDGGEGE